MLGQSGAMFGVALIEYCNEGNDVVVISADMAIPAGLGKFKKKYPEHFYNVGIAEQNLVGVAAGMASETLPVIASAQACFLSMRSFEQVRQYSGYMSIPVIYVGVSSGFSLTFFGNTHYALEDISLMRNIPGMTVLAPSDAGQAAKLLELALEQNTPCYIRCTGVPGQAPFYTKDIDVSVGGSTTVVSGTDIVVFCTGSIIRNAKSAIEKINKSSHISIALLDMYSLMPIDTEALVDSVGAKAWVSIEEHFVTGGLGGILSEYIASVRSYKKPILYRLGVDSEFTTPGEYEYLLESNQLDDEGIKESLLAVIEVINCD
jgi:transketolase